MNTESAGNRKDHEISPDGREQGNPAELFTYLRMEKWTLLIITISGLIYNAGMTAGPWFEGMLAQYLADIFHEKRMPAEMFRLAAAYVGVILIVQGSRFIKRLFVRYFANHINRQMKKNLYRTLAHASLQELKNTSSGQLLTKAITDVDVCVEGIRKFTTEIFDTGVVMIAYVVMLAWYDWRLAIIVLLFPPISYFMAERMKTVVTKTSRAARESAGRLSEAVLDRAENALTYRISGAEKIQEQYFENTLADYEEKNIRAGILESSMQPVYMAVSMTSTLFILWLGGRNVLGTGWKEWNIASFSTFLACYLKLALKSSKAAKLFNAVQKAKVSWARIKPLMKEIPTDQKARQGKAEELRVRDLSFAYPDGKQILNSINLTAEPGQIIGITGEIACGKTTLGKVLSGEYSYQGSVTWGGRELSEVLSDKNISVVSYMGHEPELFSDTIKHNILLASEGNTMQVLEDVCFGQDFLSMPEKENTFLGTGGMTLSGGQQKRIALARALYHKLPLLILDDPFSAVDQKTEEQILKNLRKNYSDRIILLISHRLRCFPSLDYILFLKNGKSMFAAHEEMFRTCPEYRRLYELQLQAKGGDLDEE